MTRRESGLLEMVKRGGTINERKIACEKLLLLTGKDYSYLLQNESFLDIITQIKNNFPMYFDSCQDLWRGAKGLIIDKYQLYEMPDFEHQLIRELLREHDSYFLDRHNQLKRFV